MEDEGEPLGRVGRIDGDVPAARLQDAEQPHDQGQVRPGRVEIPGDDHLFHLGETEIILSVWDDEVGYRIHRDQFELPEITLEADEAAVIGLASACVVVPSAVLLSPLTPVGLARIAEPDGSTV